MTMAPISTVIGVFVDYDQANGAIDQLRHTKFSYDRIRLVQRGTGNFFDTLKSMFTGQASMASNTVDDLIKMGMPEYEAQHYQQELDANHVLLLMNADDRPEEAASIMRQNGAFDINSRLRMAPSNGSAETRTAERSQETYTRDTSPTVPQSDVPVSTSDHNMPPVVHAHGEQQETYNPDVSPEEPQPDVAEPNPNASEDAYNPNVPQGTSRDF